MPDDGRSTRERLREHHRLHPQDWAAKIARELGVSRSRIHQIAAEEGLTIPSRFYMPRPDHPLAEAERRERRRESDRQRLERIRRDPARHEREKAAARARWHRSQEGRRKESPSGA